MSGNSVHIFEVVIYTINYMQEYTDIPPKSLMALSIKFQIKSCNLFLTYYKLIPS